MFLREIYLQKTKDIFLTPEDNLHKPCILRVVIDSLDFYKIDVRIQILKVTS